MSSAAKKVKDSLEGKLEVQSAELMAAKNKIQELTNTKRILFRKLSRLYEHLSSQNKNELEDILALFSDHFAAEAAIQSKRVLLADSHRKQQIIAKLALGGSGVELEIASTPEECAEKIKCNSYDLVFFDVAMMELATRAKEKNQNVGLVLMTSQDIPTYLPALKKLSGIPHIISREESDRTFTVKSIMTTVTKLLSNDIFGLEKYLSWGVDVQRINIVSSQQRSDAITDVDHYFEAVGIRRPNRERMRAVLEELLMNAIYDAPTSSEGTPLYNHLPRTVELVLKPEEQSVVRFATDGAVFAVSVEDPFGSLNGKTILRYLEHNYEGTAAALNAQENKGGAGRGLHQIVENSDLVIFNIDPGKRTEAIALFNVEINQSAQKNPAFHLFIRS